MSVTVRCDKAKASELYNAFMLACEHERAVDTIVAAQTVLFSALKIVSPDLLSALHNADTVLNDLKAELRKAMGH